MTGPVVSAQAPGRGRRRGARAGLAPDQPQPVHQTHIRHGRRHRRHNRGKRSVENLSYSIAYTG